ncbi:MAG: AAA family ATPase [Desulfurococcaceae archaeon]
MKIYIKNIGGLVGEYSFELKEGVNEVIAPNAAGKTSLVKAILALLDPSNPNVKPDEILNLDSDEGYVKLLVNGEEYCRIFRREGGRVVEVVSKPLANDERFSWLLLDQFTGVLVPKIFAGEEDVTEFVDLVFGLNKLRKVLEEKKSKEEELQVKRKHLLEKSRDLARYIQEREEIERKLREKEKELQKIEVEKVRVKEEIEKTIKELREHIGALNGKYNSYLKELEEVNERIKDLESRILALSRQVEEFYHRYPDPKAKIDSIDKDIEDIRRTISKHEERLAEMNKTYPLIIDAIESNLRYCPLCGRPIEEPEKFWEQRKNKLSEAIKDIKNRVDELRDRELRLLNEKGRIESEWARIRDIEGVEIPSLKRRMELEINKRNLLERSIKEIENEMNVLSNRIKELESRMPEEEKKRVEKFLTISGEVKALREYLEGINRRILALGDVGRELEEIERELATVIREYSELEKKFYDLRREIVIEFRKIANEVIKKIGFTWFKSISLDEHEGRYLLKVVRVLPSGREEKQSLRQLSTSERITIAVVLVLTAYKLGITREYSPDKILIIADEAMLAFDPERFENIVSEFKEYGRYIVVTRLVEPTRAPKLIIQHR